jgi:hypothetical protein
MLPMAPPSEPSARTGAAAAWPTPLIDFDSPSMTLLALSFELIRMASSLDATI